MRKQRHLNIPTSERKKKERERDHHIRYYSLIVKGLSYQRESSRLISKIPGKYNWKRDTMIALLPFCRYHTHKLTCGFC